MSGTFRVERAPGAKWGDDRRWLNKHCKNGWTRVLEGRFDGQPDPGQQLYRNAVLPPIYAIQSLGMSHVHDLAEVMEACNSLEDHIRSVRLKVTSHDLIEFQDGKMAMLFKLARGGK